MIILKVFRFWNLEVPHDFNVCYRRKVWYFSASACALQVCLRLVASCCRGFAACLFPSLGKKITAGAPSNVNHATLFQIFTFFHFIVRFQDVLLRYLVRSYLLLPFFSNFSIFYVINGIWRERSTCCEW